jgi:putative transposase
MRETKEDWLELGRDLIARGLPPPRLVVADGAAGLPSAIEEIWPRADRQHCAVHRLRNLVAKLPESEQDRVRFNYWAVVVHLRYPLRHRERWRSTNLLERSLGEVRRRTKVMGRFPGEASCLSHQPAREQPRAHTHG